MKISLKFIVLLVVILIMSFTSDHKYYISVTQVDFVKEKKAVQITSRIFIDDFESLLRERYDEAITLAEDEESEFVNLYAERYLKEKIKIEINKKEVNFSFLGKEYDGDIMRCYLEIINIDSIESIQVINKVLFDLYEEQQNLIKFKMNSKQKSFILTSENDKALLNFI